MGRILLCLPFAGFPWVLLTLLSNPLVSSLPGVSTQVHQLDHPVSTTQWHTGTSSKDLSAAPAALSPSDLSFRKSDECTSSVSSLLATASFSTTCAESIVGGNDDGSVLFSSCINYTVIPQATTAVKLTTDPYDQFCCGPCTIQYPQAVLLHWPAQRTNTWCDQIRSTLRKEGVAYGGANVPQPTIDPNFYQNAMALDPEIGGADALDNDGNLRAPYTRPPQSGVYAVAQDGFVYVSPSIYVIFPIILATNDCGLVGNAYTSWTLGVPEHQLSTYQEYYGTKAFNPADLGCPHPLQGRDLEDPGLTEAAEGMDPSVLLPADLTDLDQAWKSCTLLPLGLGRDPPRALEPASNMAPKETGNQASPTAAQRVPYPHSLPTSPGPDPTLSSITAEAKASSAPEDTAGAAAAHLQKLPSVCSPVPRSRTYLPAESSPTQPAAPEFSSPRPNIGPRREAAGIAETTTPAPLNSGADYISATSYAAYTSGIEAWALDMQSEASVMQIPPVAPSNPYMALPKHRSAKRVLTSTMSGSGFSTRSSLTREASEPEASSSVEKLPLSSATYQATPSSSLPKAPAYLPGVLPAQSALPAPPAPTHEENESVRYEPCDQDIVVVDPAITTREAGSPSILTSGESASLVALSSQEVSAPLDLDGASLPASRLSSIKTLARDLSSTVATQASVSSYAGLVASLTGVSTTTASSRSTGGPQIGAAGSRSLCWTALGLVMFAVLT